MKAEQRPPHPARPARFGAATRCEVYPCAMLRTPLRSYQRFVALNAARDLTTALLELYRDPLLRRALRVKSRALFAALLRHERGTAQLDEDAIVSLYRYYARLTTRCTPLMLFAGIGLAAIGDFTTVEQSHIDDWRLGIFPSWNSILRVTRALLAQERVRQAARYRISETVMPRGGVLCYFTEHEPAGSKASATRYKVVSLRNDPQLQPLLQDPARARSWEELAQIILTAQPSATRALADEYLFAMIDSGILIANLQPSNIGRRPERQLHQIATRLELTPLKAQSEQLLSITDTPLPVNDDRFDAAWESIEQHPWIVEDVTADEASSAAQRGGTISQAVLRIDAQAGGISRPLVMQLAALIGSTNGLWSHQFSSHRQAISDCFAEGSIGSRIPLLELAFRVLPGTKRAPAPANDQALQTYLQCKFFDADLHESEQIELDIEALNQLKTPADTPPPPFAESLFRCLHLHGRAALQHYTTTSSPGALLNRFLHWNDADPLLAQLQQIWRLQAQWAQPALLAEITCGGGGRLGDLSQRPTTYRHQIVLHGQPSVDNAQQIPLQDLSVFQSAQGPVLWWETAGVAVIPRLLSALHPDGLSPLVHLLLALDPHATDWCLRIDGAGLPVRTARLCHRDIVLAPQTWLLPPSLQLHLQKPLNGQPIAELSALLAKWRARYQVPRFVRPGDGEYNVIDLEHPLALRELREMVNAGRQRVVEEHLAASSPVIGRDGPLIGEAVAHIRLHDAESSAPSANPRPTLLETPAARRAQVFHPGASWLFLKLYYGTGLGSHAETRKFIDEELLGRFVAPLFRDLEKRGEVSQFHFVRYADPQAHLRLRLQPKHESALALLEKIRPALDEQAHRGAFVRWTVATYEREADRYGGPALIDTAETLFTIDSRLCLRMLTALHNDAIDEESELQILLPIRTLNTLLRSFGFDLPARRDLLTRMRASHEHQRPIETEKKAILDAKYRRHSRAIQSLILSLEGRDSGDVPFARRKDVASWFRVYEQALREVALIYRDAELRAVCSRSIGDILSSLFHMHCNRLFGPSELEYQAVYLCQRAVEAVHVRTQKAGRS